MFANSPFVQLMPNFSVEIITESTLIRGNYAN